jgi:hypothetical protein
VYAISRYDPLLLQCFHSCVKSGLLRVDEEAPSIITISKKRVVRKCIDSPFFASTTELRYKGLLNPPFYKLSSWKSVSIYVYKYIHTHIPNDTIVEFEMKAYTRERWAQENPDTDPLENDFFTFSIEFSISGPLCRPMRRKDEVYPLESSKISRRSPSSPPNHPPRCVGDWIVLF